VFRFPRHSRADAHVWCRGWRRAVRRAATRVLAISEFTKSDSSTCSACGGEDRRGVRSPSSARSFISRRAPSHGDLRVTWRRSKHGRKSPASSKATATTPGVELAALVGRAGWAASRSGGAGVRLDSAGCPTRASAQPYTRGRQRRRVPSLYEGLSDLRFLRGRWRGRPPRPSSRSWGGRRPRRWRATRPWIVDPLDPAAIAQKEIAGGPHRADAARNARAARGSRSAARDQFSGRAERGKPSEGYQRGQRMMREPLVVSDAT